MDNRISHFRILSIQSHVVSGYVGNKTACFPLQILGFEVDSINSVQLSNHTGYKQIKGQLLNAEDLQELYDGLKLNNLCTYTHVLTGYVGTETFLLKLVNMIKELKEINPSLYYVCDPVMGDNNQMYVPETLLPIYRDSLLPLASMITPNQYETELLTGLKIKTEQDVFQALEILHSTGVETVIITSVELKSPNKLQLFGSSTKGGSKSAVSMEIPKITGVFTGSGDVFSALILAWMAKTDGDLKVSCQNSINSMYSILARTSDFALAHGDLEAPYSMELKLIQSKNDIENPPEVFLCEHIDIVQD